MRCKWQSGFDTFQTVELLCQHTDFVTMMSSHDMGVEAILVRAVDAANIADKWVSVTMATHVYGKQDVILITNLAVWTHITVG